MTQPRLSGAWLFAIYTACIAATLSPLLWASVPPLVDFPNHLARAWILTHAASIPELAANYTVNWRILPDMAMDGVMLALSQVMPVQTAGRVFVALTLLLLIGGTAALHRVLHGRIGLWPLACLLAVYNTALFWGFVSCLFSVGFALWVFAFWVAARTWHMALRVVLFAPLAVLLLLGHLFAFGLYGLLVASFELGGLIALRRLAICPLLRAAALGLQFAPALVLWYLSLAHGGPTHTEYGNPLTKLIALRTPFTFGHGPSPLDGLTWLFSVLTLLFAASRRFLAVSPVMRVPLIVLGIAAVLMPNWLSGAWAADLRLPAVLPFLLAASTTPREVPARLRRPLVLAAIALLGLRVWSVSVAFADYDAWFSEFRAASRVIAPGARLLVVEPALTDPHLPLPGLPPFVGRTQTLAFLHMPALAVIDRAAVFPYLFTDWTTIAVTPRNAAISQPQGMAMTPDILSQSADPATAGQFESRVNQLGQRPYWLHWPADFDYVFWMSWHPDAEPVPPQFELLTTGSYFRIFKIKR